MINLNVTKGYTMENLKNIYNIEKLNRYIVLDYRDGFTMHSVMTINFDNAYVFKKFGIDCISIKNGAGLYHGELFYDMDGNIAFEVFTVDDDNAYKILIYRAVETYKSRGYNVLLTENDILLDGRPYALDRSSSYIYVDERIIGRYIS